MGTRSLEKLRPLATSKRHFQALIAGVSCVRERGSGQVVFDRSKGCYKARLRVGTLPNGRAQLRTKQARTLAEAKRLLKSMQAELGSPQTPVTSSVTFGDFALHYFSHGATQRRDC